MAHTENIEDFSLFWPPQKIEVRGGGLARRLQLKRENMGQTAKWCFVCRDCGYGREYPKEYQADQSAANHRQDFPGHTTVKHYGKLEEIHITKPARS